MTAAIARFNSAPSRASATATTSSSSPASSSRRPGRGCSGSRSAGTSCELTHNDAFAVGIMAFAQFLPYIALRPVRRRLHRPPRRAPPRPRDAGRADGLRRRPHVDRARRHRTAVDAVRDRVRQRHGARARRAVAPAAHYRMVGRDTLPNAIALNSSLFNASRIFGPSIAGIMLGFAGVGACFLVNTISFFAVLVGLLAMRTSDSSPSSSSSGRGSSPERARASPTCGRQPRMLAVLGLTVVLSTFCFNFNVTLPVLAKLTLHGQGTVYGFLSAVFGAGALAAPCRGVAGARVDARHDLGRARLHRRRAAARPGAQRVRRRACCSSSSAPASPPGRRTRTRRCSSPRPITSAAGSSASTSTPSTARARSRGLLAGWLCARGGTELAFVVAGIAGIAQPGPPEPPSVRRPPIEIPRRARKFLRGQASQHPEAGRWAAARPALNLPARSCASRGAGLCSAERPRAEPAGSYGCRRRLSAARAVGPLASRRCPASANASRWLRPFIVLDVVREELLIVASRMRLASRRSCGSCVVRGGRS